MISGGLKLFSVKGFALSPSVCVSIFRSMLFSNKSLVKKSGCRAGSTQNLNNEVHARYVDPRMAPLAVYRQCTKASGTRWRVYRGREYLAWGETKKAAIKLAFREEKRRAKEAAKEAAASYETAVPSTGATANRKPVSHYRNVCARWTGAAWRWEAFYQKNGRQVSVGLHKSQLKAAQAAAKGKQVLPSTLLKSKRIRISEEQSRCRMSAVCKPFADWCPGDLASATVARKSCGLMRQAAPGLWQAVLHGKQEPWHIAVPKVWNAMPATKQVLISGLGSGDRKLEVEGARVMHCVLATALVEWSRLRRKKPGPDFWSTHIDRNVRFHHGLLPWSQANRLVKKQTTKAGSLGVKVWQPKKAKQKKAGKPKWYAVVPFRSNVHRNRWVRLHRQGLLFNSLLVPRKTSEWCTAQEAARIGAGQIGIATGPKKYQWNWIVRANLLVEVRHHGVQQLKVDQDWDEQQVKTALAPDQGGWLPLWVRSAGGSLKSALAKLKYDGPVEMAACFACIAADTVLDAYTVEELDEAAKDVVIARKRCLKENRFEGNPSLIFRDVLCGK